jgi:SAM-dependent methyltransferase
VGTDFGTGPGVITADGCAVELYTLLPATGEPELVHGLLDEGASVLDLGAGVGRVADPLVQLGHRVVAVDDSRDMLDRVRHATIVHSRIEVLRLEERFDAVLLASYLINSPDAGQRRAFLTTAGRHVRAGGDVLVQWHPPEWFDALAAGATYPGGARYLPGRGPDSADGELISTLEVEDISDGMLRAVVTYELADRRWTHAWQAQRLAVEELDSHLHASGLRFDGFLTEDRTWFRAAACDESPRPARVGR